LIACWVVQDESGSKDATATSASAVDERSVCMFFVSQKMVLIRRSFIGARYA
jgi:hypothetical protein